MLFEFSVNFFGTAAFTVAALVVAVIINVSVAGIRRRLLVDFFVHFPGTVAFTVAVPVAAMIIKVVCLRMECLIDRIHGRGVKGPWKRKQLFLVDWLKVEHNGDYNCRTFIWLLF